LLACAFCASIVVPGVAGFVQSSVNLPASGEALETRYDLDGDGRLDLLAVFQRRALIFFQTASNTFPVAPDVEIGAGVPIPDVYAGISVGKVSKDPGLQLVLLGKNGADYISVSRLKKQSAEPVEPVPILRKKFDISAGPALRFLDAAIDMSGDGKTDIVLPNSDQLEIYEPDASFSYSLRNRVYMPLRTTQRSLLRTEPDLLGMPVLLDMHAHDMVQLLPRLDRWYGVQFAVESFCEPFLVVDFNLDKRLDIITQSRVYFQAEGGAFESSPSSVYERIASSVGVHKSRFVVAPNLVDFNGDGILDTFNVESSAAKLTPRTDVSIFLGKKDRSFDEKADFVLHTRDFAYSEVIPIGDVNADGALDIALFHLDFQPSSMESQLRAYLRNGLDGELRFYLWEKQRNRFLDVFSFKHRMLVNYEIYGSRQLFQQQVLINHDMDGDGLPDLVMKTGAQEISIFRNLGGGKGFSQSPVDIIRTPRRFSSIIVQDLNGDKRGDVIVSGYLESQDDRTIYTFFLSV
jgi:hypothetical protein